jgi:Fe-S-cluster-containing dehydrogenase component
VPACVASCPVGARHFGDLGDAESPVSQLVAEREGYSLMPELGYAPVNQYLPPRPSQAHAGCTGAAPLPEAAVAPASGFLRWVDRLLSR